jgi:hypothetical protein
MNEKYSHKDFSGKSLIDVDPKELNDTEIHGSCFAQEVPFGKQAEFVRVFPEEMTGVTFVGCNLDNVLVPEGCKAIDGTHKLLEIHKETVGGEDVFTTWIMSEAKVPIAKVQPDIVVIEEKQ